MVTQKYAYVSMLEDALDNNASDGCIMAILSNFTDQDYLDYDIIFGLIVAKRINVLWNVYREKKPFSYLSTAEGNALHVACGAGGSLDAVKFLYENGIMTDVNVPTDVGETPFLLAIMYNHSDIVRYFLEHAQPNLKLQTRYGDTAYSLASKKIMDLLKS